MEDRDAKQAAMIDKASKVKDIAEWAMIAAKGSPQAIAMKLASKPLTDGVGQTIDVADFMSNEFKSKPNKDISENAFLHYAGTGEHYNDDFKDVDWESFMRSGYYKRHRAQNTFLQDEICNWFIENPREWAKVLKNRPGLSKSHIAFVKFIFGLGSHK